MAQLSADFKERVAAGFRPRTLAAYRQKFRLYMSFMVHLKIQDIDSMQAVSLFFEFLAQQGLRAQTLTNYLTVLKHFFAIYNLNLAPLGHRLITLAIRAVAYNTPLSFRIKGIITVAQLKQLVQRAIQLPDGHIYKAVILLGFFGFYRLSTLLPPSVAAFSNSRFPTHGDIIWGAPGAHVITKCSKNMQVSGQVHVIQLPVLTDKEICPVTALKIIVSSDKRQVDKPLFTVKSGSKEIILTASKMRKTLRVIVSAIGLRPSELGFHTFRRSGACWAFDHNIDLNQIKVHGGWRSDAIWRYLIKTPAAAGSVAKTFQNFLD